MDLTITLCERRVEVIGDAAVAAYQVQRPNFEETLYFLLANSYC